MRLLILVLGAKGQLGEAMTVGLASSHEVVALGRAELDVTAADRVQAEIASICPDVIVNCTADNDVDGAEEAQLRPLAVNAIAVRSLARAAAAVDATLVHYSTDFVFDGTEEPPRTESDPPNPRSVYAMTKLLGEWFAEEAPSHYVLRIESLFGGPARKSSVDRMLSAILEGREVRAFTDRTVSPTYVDDVVDVTRRLIETRAPFGLYHCVNSGSTTWMGIARELAMLAGRPEAPITGIEMASATLRAPRPRFAALDHTRLDAIGISVPTWQDGLKRYVRSLSLP